MGSRCTVKSRNVRMDDSSDFSAEIWPLRGGNTPKEKEAPVSVAIPRGATRGRSSPARGRHGQHGACARPISRPDRGRHGRATRPRIPSSGRASKFSPEKSNPDPRSLPPHRPRPPQEDERYCFIVEWLDPHSGLTMRYQMLYGPADCSVEMVRHEPDARRFIPFIPTPT